MPHIKSTLLAALAIAATVSAHGYVKNIVVNGVSYEGYISDSFPYMSNPPIVAGWTISQEDLGYVAPDAYQGNDIICHRNATNAKGHITVKAGDKISLGWTTWPSSHHGPVITYLANCGSGGCETVDKTTLKFFKIDAVGLLDDTSPPGNWATDVLEANNNTWLVEIPPTLAAGYYVMRHEIIALHSAGNADGAQNYPFCINFKVTGGGSAAPAGVAGTALYKSTDPGILVNIYTSLSTYTIPGPTPASGAVTYVSQSSSAITTSASATTTA